MTDRFDQGRASDVSSSGEEWRCLGGRVGGFLVYERSLAGEVALYEIRRA